MAVTVQSPTPTNPASRSVREKLMRKKAAIALACLFANAVFAQETQLRLDSTRYDFGKVLAGTIIRHDFTFTNVGSTTLEISSVEPSCECVTVETGPERWSRGKRGASAQKWTPAKSEPAAAARSHLQQQHGREAAGGHAFWEVWNEIDVETDGIALDEVVLHVGATKPTPAGCSP